MNLTIKLTPEQNVQIQDFYLSPGTCICGLEFIRNQNRAMLAQPVLATSTLTIGALCDGCFKTFNELFKSRKELAKDIAGKKV